MRDRSNSEKSHRLYRVLLVITRDRTVLRPDFCHVYFGLGMLSDNRTSEGATTDRSIGVIRTRKSKDSDERDGATAGDENIGTVFGSTFGEDLENLLLGVSNWLPGLVSHS